MKTRKRLTDLKREAIVQAATSLFQTLGFEGTSMDRVAEAADVSKRTLYNHFPSKEELFAEVCYLLWPGRASPLPSYKQGRPVREQLIEFVGQVVKQLSEDSLIKMARIGLSSMLRSPQWAEDLLNRLDPEKASLAWLKAAHQDGQLLGCDPSFAALELEALINGLAFWRQVTMRQSPLNPEAQSQVRDAIVEMFLSRYLRT